MFYTFRVENMSVMDDKITLDKKSFEALAADSRIQILKSLGKRRKTLSELAAQLKLAPSTVKEHLQVLVGAELAEMKDEGRKWKYYELTWKGRKIVQPSEIKIWVVLSISVLAMIAALFNFFSKLPGQAEPIEPFMNVADEEMAEAAAGEVPRTMAEQAMAAPTPAPIEPTVAIDLVQALLPDLILLLLATVVFGILLGYVIKKKA